MKKIVRIKLITLVSFSLLITQTRSLIARSNEIFITNYDESIFILDEELLNNKMMDLDKLNQYLDNNNNETYESLLESGSQLINNISDQSNPLGFAQESGPPLGIPSFLWGCVLSWVGLIVVYVVTDSNKEEVKRAFMGCLVNGAVTIALYGLALLVRLNSI